MNLKYESSKPANLQEETPPVFKRWRHWYLLVIAFLVVQVLLFYWLTVSFE